MVQSGSKPGGLCSWTQLCDSFFFFLIVIFYLFIYLFIYLFYFWLCWVFVSVRGLSPVAASGGHSSSRCAGLFTIAASLVAEHRLQTHRLSSCGSQDSLLRGMWDLPRPGFEPVSPALAGRFSTTAPPGKPCDSLLFLLYFKHSRRESGYFIYMLHGCLHLFHDLFPLMKLMHMLFSRKGFPSTLYWRMALSAHYLVGLC